MSPRVFRAKRHFFKLPRYRLGFCEETQNYAKRKRSQIFSFLFFFLFQQSLLGQYLVKVPLDWSPLGVTKSLSHTQMVSFRGSKFPTNIPVCSILESLPPGGFLITTQCFNFLVSTSCIMQVNDTAMRLFSDTQDEDQKRIADLVVERMEREYSPTLEPKTATGAALTGSKFRFSGYISIN